MQFIHLCLNLHALTVSCSNLACLLELEDTFPDFTRGGA